MSQPFVSHIQEGYTFKGTSIELGAAVLDGSPIAGATVKLPLKSFNRHGLIAGATGTGKTITLQVITEQLSQFGVPTMVMDIKGDLSGIAAQGAANERIESRHKQIGLPHEVLSNPVELLTLSKEPGARLRATVTEFGPVLFSRILDLNDVQSGIVSVAFKYCDDHDLPLLNLGDFRKVLHYMMDDGKEEAEKLYGRISPASVGAILRRLMELEQQGADLFFGEPSFDVFDLLKTNSQGKGIIHVVRLIDIQDRPKLFSTFMLQLLAEIYSTFPEVGDAEKPRLVLFFDEAHLIFQEASRELLRQIESIVKLIRSKGVGIFFVTQNPVDIPEAVLSQLGLKVQHALRAFTAKDRRAIRMAAENYPLSDFYNTSEILTSLGVGEALVTALNDKGIPTPLAHTMLRAPGSRMGILSESEISNLVAGSTMATRYNRTIDRRSAEEILTERLEAAHKEEHIRKMKEQAEPVQQQRPSTINRQPAGRRTSTTSSTRRTKSTIEQVIDSTAGRQVGRTVAREITRGLLGVLGIRKR